MRRKFGTRGLWTVHALHSENDKINCPICSRYSSSILLKELTSARVFNNPFASDFVEYSSVIDRTVNIAINKSLDITLQSYKFLSVLIKKHNENLKSVYT